MNHAECIIIPEFNKFAGNIFKMKLKQANQATNCDFNTVTTCSQKQRKN